MLPGILRGKATGKDPFMYQGRSFHVSRPPSGRWLRGFARFLNPR
jgi:hypothetical protein